MNLKEGVSLYGNKLLCVGVSIIGVAALLFGVLQLEGQIDWFGSSSTASFLQPPAPEFGMIDNTVPRTDVNGVIMDIHDGNILHINDTFFYYGASYGECTEFSGVDGCKTFALGNCGFQNNHNLSLFTSRDFVEWTPAPTNPVFQFTSANQPQGIMFCPKVVYNRRTSMYVLWFNWFYNPTQISFIGVATSLSPFGPFDVVTSQVVGLRYTNPGDFGLLVDDDDSGYIVYTSIDNGHDISTELLQPDYLSSTGINSGFFAQFVEAPALFKHKGTYYASISNTCCYCAQGANVTLYSAAHPLGPWTSPGTLISNQRDVPAQQTNILSYTDGDGVPRLLYQADRWQTAPDRLKAHDLTYFAPMDLTSVEVVASFNVSFFNT